MKTKAVYDNGLLKLSFDGELDHHAAPKCGGTDYIAKALTKDMEYDIERQQ